MDQQENAFDWSEFGQRTWVVVIAGLVFAPLGIFLAWRKPDWTPKAKWIATGLMGLLFYGQFLNKPNADVDNTSRREVVNAPSGEAVSTNAAAANPKGKLTAFKAVVAQFKQFPDRFTPDSQRTAYNEELGKLVREFTEYPFDAKANPSIGRSIVELFEAKIEGNYTGYHFNCVDECVRNIYVESLNR